jgi:hypothetical protein
VRREKIMTQNSELCDLGVSALRSLKSIGAQSGFAIFMVNLLKDYIGSIPKRKAGVEILDETVWLDSLCPSDSYFGLS